MIPKPVSPDKAHFETAVLFISSLFNFHPLGDLDSNRPVPFRLTPNIAEFLTSTGVTGPLTASMVATARCLIQPQYKLSSFLRAILRDEYITWNKKVQSDVPFSPATSPCMGAAVFGHG